MRAPILDGKRVRLRAPSESDLPFLLRFANDQELRGWLRFWRPTTEAEELAWVRALETGDDIVWLIEGDGELRGSIGLHQVDRVSAHAELGLGILGAASRGRGYGTEACALALRHGFLDLGLHRVYLHVFDDNPATRLYERLGFRREGTMRQHGWKRGAWRDQHVYGLLREEWSP